MFLPMSWTSPLTVAITTVPLVSFWRASVGSLAFSSSMKGIR